MSLEDEFCQKIMQETKAKTNKMLRLLCCSKSWNSPLLWGHYADRHTGIALELEAPESHVQEIQYSKDRVALDLHSLMRNRHKDENAKWTMFKMFMTKGIQWAYEDEARLQFTLDDLHSLNGHDFFNLNDTIKITGLVLGVNNKTTDSRIISAVPNNHQVSITKTQMSALSFEIQEIKKYNLPM
ncbi:hypothetical protein DSLASN_22890 [Desulfoluna limicola]|uniref:DUF2971 domain-containing protein n=2 Tax=Desulfoluna limicola TaxID=2810562 RepID=A0ABN6F2I1_9BACT|nr:hypothetical protein DSLASN_22890 [Desulfoluna limicola]